MLEFETGENSLLNSFLFLYFKATALSLKTLIWVTSAMFLISSLILKSPLIPQISTVFSPLIGWLPYFIELILSTFTPLASASK